MNLRPLLLSVAVLAPLAAAVWWFQRPEPPPSLNDARVGARLADADVLARAARIRLALPGGESVAFSRAGGDRWSVDGTPALPADVSKLARLSSTLVNTRVERLVTRNPDRLPSLGLGATRVAYLDANDAPLLEIDLGNTAEGGGRFLRYGAEKQAYLARLAYSPDATAAAWRDNLLAHGLAAANIASLRIQFGDTFAPASVTLIREKSDAPWTAEQTPGGHRVKQSLVTGQLTTLTNLRHTRVAPRVDPGVVAARVFPREVEIKTFAGRTITLAFQRVPEPPAPAEGETAPPAAPRPVYVEVADSEPDPLLAAAGKTHAFEVAEWVFNGLPAKTEDLFEPLPEQPAAAQPAAEQPATERPAAE